MADGVQDRFYGNRLDYRTRHQQLVSVELMADGVQDRLYGNKLRCRRRRQQFVSVELTNEFDRGSRHAVRKAITPANIPDGSRSCRGCFGAELYHLNKQGGSQAFTDYKCTARFCLICRRFLRLPVSNTPWRIAVIVHHIDKPQPTFDLQRQSTSLEVSRVRLRWYIVIEKDTHVHSAGFPVLFAYIIHCGTGSILPRSIF